MTKKEKGLAWVVGSTFVFLVDAWGGTFIHSFSGGRWWSFPLVVTQMVVMFASLLAFANGLKIIAERSAGARCNS